MTDTPPPLASIPVPAGATIATTTWDSDPEAEAFVFCRLTVAVGPTGADALLAGGLDLMMERFVLPGDVTRVQEPAPTGHRLVLTRTPGQRLRPAAGLRVEGGPSEAPELDTFGPAVDSWFAGRRVGTPAATPAPAAPRRATDPRTRTFVEELATPPTKRPVTLVERPVSVREGAALGAQARASRARPRSPLQAWDAQVKPRRERRAAVPDVAAEPAAPAPEPTDEPVTPSWALIGSVDLLETPALVVPALRRLRGFLRVGFGGVADRALLQRRADQLGVPLDGIFAMKADHPHLEVAVGCRRAAMAVLVSPPDPHPPGSRRVETTPEGLMEAVDALIALVEAGAG